MKCFFFGHSFGRIEADGYQYCKNCGTAQKPNPCEHGHNWQTVSKLGYSGYYPRFGGGVEWRDTKLAQVCANCQERQSIWEFGH